MEDKTTLKASILQLSFQACFDNVSAVIIEKLLKKTLYLFFFIRNDGSQLSGNIIHDMDNCDWSKNSKIITENSNYWKVGSRL